MRVLQKQYSEKNLSFDLLEILSEKCRLPVPDSLKGLETREIRHNANCDKTEMKSQVEKILGI